MRTKVRRVFCSKRQPGDRNLLTYSFFVLRYLSNLSQALRMCPTLSLPLETEQGFRERFLNIPSSLAGGLWQGEHCLLIYLHPFLWMPQFKMLILLCLSKLLSQPGLLQQSPKSLPVSTVYS